MISSFLPLFVDHCWQSTLCVIAAAWLASFFRKHQAKTRHWIWLAASLKFLVPFILFVNIGSHVEWRTVNAPPSPPIVEPINQPSENGPPITGVHPANLPSHVSVLPIFLLFVWTAGFVAVIFRYLRQWSRLQAIRHNARNVELSIPVQAMCTPELLQPAIFGLFSQVLLLPEGITNCLNAGQLDAVFAHELCHVRRRDNLASACHMLVEAVFWFHPLVWWIGAKLIEERERACDEAVLGSGVQPELYAKAILNVCKLYLEAPTNCAVGVSGANLKARVVEIMAGEARRTITRRGELLLALSLALVFALPITVGLLKAPPRNIKPSQTAILLEHSELVSVQLLATPKISPGFKGPMITMLPGTLIIKSASVGDLIRRAYRLPAFQTASGLAWIEYPDYEVKIKAPGAPAHERWMKLTQAEIQTLLADRFKLKFHHETRQLPVYLLTAAKDGSKLQPSKPGSCVPFDWATRLAPSNPHQKIYCGFPMRGLTVQLNHTIDSVGVSTGGSYGNPATMAALISSG